MLNIERYKVVTKILSFLKLHRTFKKNVNFCSAPALDIDHLYCATTEARSMNNNETIKNFKQNNKKMTL